MPVLKIVYDRKTGEIRRDGEINPEQNQSMLEEIFRNYLRAHPEMLAEETQESAPVFG